MSATRYVHKKMQKEMSAKRYVIKKRKKKCLPHDMSTKNANVRHKICPQKYYTQKMATITYCGHILWRTFVYLSDTTDPNRILTLESDVWYSPKGPGARGTKKKKLRLRT